MNGLYINLHDILNCVATCIIPDATFLIQITTCPILIETIWISVLNKKLNIHNNYYQSFMKNINFFGLNTDKRERLKLLEIVILILVAAGIFFLLTITLN
jgi:hypothetical protein